MAFTWVNKVGAAALLAVACYAVAAPALDPAKSSLAVVFKQLGVPVEAKFTTFAGEVNFDPANPAAASARVEVDVASFDIGDPEYSKEVRKKEWFDATAFPKATFVTTSIRQLAADKLEAAGKLTVKGRSQDVKVQIAVKQQGANRVFEGSLPISRLYFNIGEGAWKDTDVLEDAVLIKFKVVQAAQ